MFFLVPRGFPSLWWRDVTSVYGQNQPTAGDPRSYPSPRCLGRRAVNHQGSGAGWCRGGDVGLKFLGKSSSFVDLALFVGSRGRADGEA